MNEYATIIKEQYIYLIKDLPLPTEKQFKKFF